MTNTTHTPSPKFYLMRKTFRPSWKPGEVETTDHVCEGLPVGNAVRLFGWGTFVDGFGAYPLDRNYQILREATAEEVRDAFAKSANGGTQ